MGFLKFSTARTTDVAGRALQWGRAELDGAPFRGSETPLLKSEEIERALEKVRDVFSGTFDTSKPEMKHHQRTYQQVLEGAAAQWIEIIVKMEKWWDKGPGEPPVMLVYLEWAEPYMELVDSGGAHNGKFVNFQR